MPVRNPGNALVEFASIVWVADSKIAKDTFRALLGQRPDLQRRKLTAGAGRLLKNQMIRLEVGVARRSKIVSKALEPARVGSAGNVRL